MSLADPYFRAWAQKHLHTPHELAGRLGSLLRTLHSEMKNKPPDEQLAMLERHLLIGVVGLEAEVAQSIWNSQKEAVMGMADVQYEHKGKPVKTSPARVESLPSGALKVIVEVDLEETST